MKSFLGIVISLCLLVFLGGCAGPVSHDYPPVVESGAEDADSYPDDFPPLEEELALEPEPASPPPPVVNPAVVSLTNQARGQYNARNYQGAIATAERGLRIDRRAPDLYLVLAQSYLQLAMYQQAEQFVQQGLRFALTGSTVSESLLRVRDILNGGAF